MNYLRTAREGDVICESTLDRRNDRVAVMRSEVHDETRPPAGDRDRELLDLPEGAARAHTTRARRRPNRSPRAERSGFSARSRCAPGHAACTSSAPRSRTSCRSSPGSGSGSCTSTSNTPPRAWRSTRTRARTSAPTSSPGSTGLSPTARATSVTRSRAPTTCRPTSSRCSPGTSLTLPIAAGRPALGTWQGIYLCEFRDPAAPGELIATLHGDD